MFGLGGGGGIRVDVNKKLKLRCEKTCLWGFRPGLTDG